MTVNVKLAYRSTGKSRAARSPSYRAGDPLAAGIEYAGREDNDLVLWSASASAVIAGDSLVDSGRRQVSERLRPLLDLPVEG
jgi:hypothetical protein